LDDFPPPYTVRETGKTLEANALLKARRAVKETGCAALSDDTGLEIAALGGRPGVYSARFAGSGCSYADNTRKVLAVDGRCQAGQRRTAVFRTVVAFVTPEGHENGFSRAGARGKSPTRRPGEPGGFGYDPVFEPRGEGRTFAQMPLARKNKISHRAKAFHPRRRLFAPDKKNENRSCDRRRRVYRRVDGPRLGGAGRPGDRAGQFQFVLQPAP
jgi:XTP/dITP diphosphohydrolase